MSRNPAVMIALGFLMAQAVIGLVERAMLARRVYALEHPAPVEAPDAP